MKKCKVLDSSFFNRPTVEVARELIGKWLCRRVSESSESFRIRICETEAYDGLEDKACHAHRGKTARNEVMFGPAGHWYVYLCYGMHWMLNAVTGPEDFPAAVLIRGCCGVVGPGRLTKAFSVNRKCDRLEISEKSGLWVEDDNFVVNCDEIFIGPGWYWLRRSGMGTQAISFCLETSYGGMIMLFLRACFFAYAWQW